MDQLILYIDGKLSGDKHNDDGFEVIQYSFHSDREIDQKGQPASKQKSMIIELEVYSMRSSGNMIEILIDQQKKVKGRIEFFTNDPGGGRVKFKTLKFESAYIFKYSEKLSGHRLTMNLGDFSSMTEKISLTAGKVDVEGASYSHEWAS